MNLSKGTEGGDGARNEAGIHIFSTSHRQQWHFYTYNFQPDKNVTGE